MVKKYKKLKKDLREAGMKPKTLGRTYAKTLSKVGKKSKKFKKIAFKSTGSKKATGRRTTGTRNLLSAAGVIQGSASRSGAGRPRGTYKYGMPISEYKKVQSQRKALIQQYQQDRLNKLSAKGLTPEQVRMIQLQRSSTVPSRMEEQMPQRYSPQMQPMTKSQEKRAQVQQLQELVDDELEFQKYTSDKTLSPSTQKILSQIRRIQNKGKSDNVRQQRILTERKLVERSMNLMNAHKNMQKIELDFTGVNPEENILMAPSVFKENPQNNIMTQRRLNVLQTREGGNQLKF